MGKDNTYDAIVIGAGQNGLTTAAYLAKGGFDTLLLEAEDHIGGRTYTTELTVPGFKHDLAATGFIFGLGSPCIQQDELGLIGKYGLDLNLCPPERPAVVNVFQDGTVLPVWDNIDRMCEEIAKYSKHDAVAYKKFYEYVSPMVGMMQMGMNAAPPSMGALFAELDTMPLGKELIKALFMSAYEMIEPWFEDERTMVYLLNYASEALVDPFEGGSALYVLTLVATQHIPGSTAGFPRGGMISLVNALQQSILDNGGTILKNSPVNKIITKDGRAVAVETEGGEVYHANKAIISTIHPKLTMNEWLDTPLDEGLRDEIDRIQDPSAVGFMTHIALDHDPVFIGENPVTQVGTEMCLITTKLDEYIQFWTDVRKKQLPDPKARIMSLISTRADPARAPEGKAIQALWVFVPWDVNGDANNWDTLKEDYSARSYDAFCTYTTNMTRDDILGSKIMSPLDYSRVDKAAYHGAVMGAKAAMYQYMAYRPVPELGQYRTPVEGLYLGGENTHPGGGVTLGGRSVAQTVLEDCGIDFDDVVD
ncbi:MAG: phytoene desaturase family protein [Coriobacteriales bacterium]|jgi:beta-carotene ketolase (CrtO type)